MTTPKPVKIGTSCCEHSVPTDYPCRVCAEIRRELDDISCEWCGSKVTTGILRTQLKQAIEERDDYKRKMDHEHLVAEDALAKIDKVTQERDDIQRSLLLEAWIDRDYAQSLLKKLNVAEAERDKWKWEYENLCKFATQFEEQRDAALAKLAERDAELLKLVESSSKLAAQLEATGDVLEVCIPYAAMMQSRLKHEEDRTDCAQVVRLAREALAKIRGEG